MPKFVFIPFSFLLKFFWTNGKLASKHNRKHHYEANLLIHICCNDFFYSISGLEKLAIDPTISVQKGNLIAVIPEWGPNFRITFDLNVHSMYSSHSNGWANVLHFTASGKDCCSIGDRVPALWTNSKRDVFQNKNI